MKKIYLTLLMAVPLAAQVHFGVKGGAPLSDAIETEGGFQGKPSRWTVGPMVDLDLPFGLGVEFDALYRRNGYVSGGVEQVSSDWQFPLLAKYKFPGIGIRPYIDGGLSFRRLGDVVGLKDENSTGWVAGAGIQIKVPFVRISPELRYTRWNDLGIDAGSSTGYARGSKNQFEFLVGLTF